MKESMTGLLVRVLIFLLVCCLGIFAIVAIYGKLRFTEQRGYKAVFSNVSGLGVGEFVRIAGVEVGKVTKVHLNADTTVLVEFTAEESAVLTEGSRAVVRYENLIGDRYLALQEGSGGSRVLQSGDTIPIERTQPAVDLNALIGGFRPLLRALNPDQVNALTGQLVQVLQGQGVTISEFLSQTADLTSTLADRDRLIGEVIGNLNGVLGVLGDQRDQFDKAVDSVSQLVRGLADRRQDLAAGLANLNETSVTVADLLTQARPPLKNTVHQADRVGAIAVADHDYLDNLLNTLPDKYQLLARQGLYGDYFSFYLCDVLLKLNGKGGQPVYVKVAGQASGRCTPK